MPDGEPDGLRGELCTLKIVARDGDGDDNGGRPKVQMDCLAQLRCAALQSDVYGWELLCS